MVGKSYKTTNNQALGYLVDYKAGVQKEFRNIYLASSLIIPVYKKWKKDAIFLENPNDKVGIWFRGYGLSITLGKFLK